MNFVYESRSEPTPAPLPPPQRFGSLRTLRRHVRTPGEAWLLARVLLWGMALPLLKYALPLPRLVRLVEPRYRLAPRPRPPEHTERLLVLVDGMYRRVPVLSRDNCLERSLLTYRLLRNVGARPRLVVGIRRQARGAGAADLAPRTVIEGHVWLELAGRPLGESPTSLSEFIPVATFPGRYMAPPAPGSG
ncbi:MAG TPA: lasso peptide biosynthesis B2 protein [Chloroflexia bacterium]